MKINFIQHAIVYTLRTPSGEFKEQMISTFWTDEQGNIDESNLPTDREIVELLSMLVKGREIYSYETGTIQEESV